MFECSGWNVLGGCLALLRGFLLVLVEQGVFLLVARPLQGWL